MPRVPAARARLAALLLPFLAASCSPAPDAGVPGADADADGDARPLFADLEAFSWLPEHPEEGASTAFWEHWGDGRAELAGYRLETRRYGALREGELTLVYVTEPHDRRTWIKDDHVDDPHRVEVLKLLVNREFLTGIYPYNAVTAAFAPVEPWGAERFQPVRVNLDVNEWCGTVTHRLWPGQERFRSLRLSYFAQEGEVWDERALPGDALYEDALLIQLRELDGPFQEGAAWEGALVPALWNVRAGRTGLAPVEARISREEARRDGEPVTRFVIEAELEGGEYRRVVDVERSQPRRIVGWETVLDGEMVEAAELLDSRRLAYWELNRPGDEGYREELGLAPPAEREGGATPDGCGL